jgi:biofilm protein TabA
MIIERLANSAGIADLPPRVKQALDYLRRTDLTSLAIGRHDLDDGRLFALVQDYTTRAADQCVWEAHRKYIDVQYVVRGVERMGCAKIALSRELQPYDPARDVVLFEPGSDYVTVAAGMFAIFWPEDVHSPGVAVDDTAPVAVRKIVIKVAVTS